jgi:choline dehydrogenase-like flavoprotein
MSSERDLVIVGCGIAGMSVAVTALQAGLQVTLLERAPEEDFGGNSRWTEAYQRMKNDAAISDDFEQRFAQNSPPRRYASGCSGSAPTRCTSRRAAPGRTVAARASTARSGTSSLTARSSTV